MAASWTGRTPRTIRRWVAAGLLVPVGRDRNGGLVFRIRDVLLVERSQRRNRESRIRAHLLRRAR